MSRYVVLAVVAIVGVASSLNLMAQNANSDSMRIWKSKKGNDSVEASLVEFDKHSRIVTLRDATGELIHVNIAQLSTEDRRFVASNFKSKGIERKASIFQRSGRAESVESRPALDSDIVARKSSTDRQRLYGIDWIPDLENALDVASSTKRKKPVMWFRVLGELDGFM